MFKSTLVSTLIALLALQAAQASAPVCQNIFKLESQSYIYSKGVDSAKNPSDHMQIGYESEYLFSESGAILRDYAPTNMPRETWDAMSDEQHIAWLKSQFKDRPEFAVGTGLKKQVQIDFMPDELIVDSTGNIEIVLMPFDSYQSWEAAVDLIVKRYGVGSQQAMISKARQSAFLQQSSSAQKKLTEKHLGWLVFSNLKDTYLKLDSGYDRYIADKTKLTALSFDHPFLGPMTKVKRDVLEQFLAENAKGNKYDADSKSYVRKSDASFKYTGGPSYRPDVAGPGRFSWEIRNSHKDVKDLKMKVRRDLLAHSQGLEPYTAFASVPAFDTIKEFAKLPKDVQDMLKTLFPSKADPRFDYNENEKLALEMFRNFSMPMMNLESLAKALETDPQKFIRLNTQIASARLIYLQGLKEVSQSLKNGTLDLHLGRAHVMGLLGEFARKSGIPAAFEKKAQAIGHENKSLPNEDLHSDLKAG